MSPPNEPTSTGETVASFASARLKRTGPPPAGAVAASRRVSTSASPMGSTVPPP